MFTYQYLQPTEYHFSLDSIHLAELVAEKIKGRDDLASLRILDLCAGCGVIGIELSWYCPELRYIDFVEVQEVYTTYFKENVALVDRSELQLNWHLLNYDELHNAHWKNKFDVIVSNPPYFMAGHGILSPSKFKNRCRFYLDSSFDNYIKALVNTLNVSGKAYFLLRSLKEHDYNVFSRIQDMIKDLPASIEIISQIRGTDVFLLKKQGK
jgi:tRNA1(Val) A37 N6-methylase TrmN6